MNSPIIIQTIASFLDAKTLSSFAQVCKSFQKASKFNDIWERLFNLRYISSLDIFGEIITGKQALKPINVNRNFFVLYKEAISKEKQWKDIVGKYFSQCDIQVLQDFTADTLKNPMLPSLCLRREAKNFQTIVQDLIGNAFSEPLGFNLPSQAEEIVSKLFEFEAEIYAEFSESGHKKRLIKERWLIKSNKSVKKPGFSSSSLKPSQSPYFLCQFVKVLRNIFKIHCKSVMTRLEKITEIKEFLSEYCLRFEGYSASIVSLESAFSPLCILFNTLYDKYIPHHFRTPNFSVLRLMLITWRRVVFVYTAESLVNSVVQLLTSMREIIRKDPASCLDPLEIDLILISKTVQFFVDLSSNELSLQYINHSKFKAGSAYMHLEQKIERISHQYYLDISTLPLKTVKKLLQQDAVVISRAFLPRTCNIINIMLYETLLQSYQSHYFGLYKEYNIYFNDDKQTDPIVYTAFGKMLFSNDMSLASTKKVKNFVEYLKVKNMIEDIKEYNDIDFKVEELKKGHSDKDEEIEYLNGIEGFKLEQTAEEQLFFCIDQDFEASDYEKIVKGY